MNIYPHCSPLLFQHRPCPTPLRKKMGTTVIIYQDFADKFQGILQPASPYPAEPCPICSATYGSAASPNPNMEAQTLEDFSTLPFAHGVLNPHITLPILTPCGHHFCCSCIYRWLLEAPTCPFCRTQFDLPTRPEPNIHDSSDFDIHPPTIPLSHLIGQWSVRRVLITPIPSNVPFIWRRERMVADLPKTMIQLARRFYHQSCHKKPSDLSFLKPHRPFDMPGGRIWISLPGMYLVDAPMAMTEDAERVCQFLTEKILDDDFLATSWSDGETYCYYWEDLLKSLVEEVKSKFPDATGGAGSVRWWKYIELVVLYLAKWQYHCDRVIRAAAT